MQNMILQNTNQFIFEKSLSLWNKKPKAFFILT